MTSVPFTAIPPPTPQPSDLAAAPNPAGSDGPLVSIIIRSMGRPSLVEALASLAGQTYRRLEAVVVDATGGQHPPLPVLPRPLDVRLVSASQRLQRSAAANFGLAQARGELLGFLDDDDFLAAEHVACLVARMQQADAPDLVHAGTWLIDRFHRVVGERNDPVNRLVTYFDGPFTIMSALFHRRHWERGCRFSEELQVLEDWDFWMQLLPQARVAMVDQRTQLYFQEAGDSGTAIGQNADVVRNKPFLDRFKARWQGHRDADWGVYMQQLQAGAVLQEAGRLQEARRHYARLLTEHRDEPNALFLLAQVFARQGTLFSARRMLMRAVTRNPQAAEYWQMMAQVEEALGNPAGAIGALNHAVNFKPTLQADAEVAIARLRAAMPAPAAAPPAPKALPRGASFAAFGAQASIAPPADLPQRLQQALQTYRSGELSTARRAYEAILQAVPRNPDALQALARLAFDYGELAQAARYLNELPPAQRARHQVRRLVGRIERLRWTRAENARVFAQIRRLPFLLDLAAGVRDAARRDELARSAVGSAGPQQRESESPSVPRPPALVHLLLPAADREWRMALPWAALIERVLRGHAEVRRWICEGQAGVWGTADRESAGWRQIDVDRGQVPRHGSFVFCGIPECPPAWLRDSSVARLLMLPLDAGAGDLLELMVNAHHQTGVPVGVMLSERSGQLDGAAFDAVDVGDGAQAAEPGGGDPPADGAASLAGPAIVLRLSAEDIVDEVGVHATAAASEPVPGSAMALAERPFTIGYVAGPELQPFHPDDAALWRHLSAHGLRVRILGGASLACHFPPTQMPSGLELLPPGAIEPAAFLAGLDCLLVRDAPHRRRGLGTAIPRAMAQRLPVLVARGGADSDLIDDGGNGLLFEGNEQAIAIIERLARDRGEGRRIGAAAQASMRDRFGAAYRRRLRELLIGA